MNKSTKGAIAAAASAVLLLGGAGSLAYWNAEGNIGASTITAGEMKLINPSPGTWTLNGTDVTSNISAVRVVPGDTLTYTGSWEIQAVGQNLEATVAFSGVGTTGSLPVVVTDTYELDNTALASGAEITSGDDGKTLEATVVVDFPFGTTADNTSQTATVNLAAGTVTLTQTDATP